MNRILIFLLMISLCFGCGDEPKTMKSTDDEANKQADKGSDQDNSSEIIFGKPRILSVKANSSESYLLYLPEGIDTSRLKVLYLLEPHAEVDDLIRQYRGLADTFNWALVGSRTIRNGFTFEASDAVIHRLREDVKRRLTVQEEALWGFSGAAKMALNYTRSFPDMDQVIYVGGATVINNEPMRILGIAGKGDMNFSDLLAFDLGIQNGQVTNTIISWDGGHEHPPAMVMRDAFLWLEEEAIPDLESKKAYLSPKDLRAEQSLKKRYYEAFQNQDTAWWSKEIQFLRDMSGTDRMYERVLGFVGLACYSYAENALKSKNIQRAERILTIYEMADPKNEDLAKFKIQLQGLKSSGGF